ncbi:MAG TPA: hypothetical protein VEB00_11610 [Clostridia bacterium]|nr:hypothetical protein [Clostridia bacterium]
MKRFISFVLLTILMAIPLCGCEKDKNKNGEIPYLPISVDNISYIGLYGYSQEGKHSNNREATEQEITQIIGWLNSIEEYDSEIEIPKNSNGRPVPSDIQIFPKFTPHTEFLYILEKDNDYIILCIPKINKGYVAKQQELNKLLKELRR